MPRRVCHVLASATGGVWMVEQLRELRRRYGYEVYVVVGGAEGPLVDLLRAEQIPYHVTAFVTSPSHLRHGARTIRDLARFFRQMRFDVVQSHVYGTILTARPAAWIADVPLRLSMVSGPFHLEAPPSRWLDRVTCWMESTVVASCESIRNAYREMGVSDARTELIYYGVDTQKFDARPQSGVDIRADYGWPADTPVVALVSWFYTRLPASWWVPEALHDLGFKGQEDFVIAASLIRAKFPTAKFLLVGGPFDAAGAVYMNDVRALVQSLNLADEVIFTGHRSDVHRILRDVDVAVQASLTESCGGTIEGLLAQMPMVATRVGGMVDTIRDGETGILVEPDNPRDLARGILELLSDRTRARALGHNGRKLMLERFSLDRTVSDLHALYDRLLAEQSTKRRGYNRLVSLWRSALMTVVAVWCMVRLEIGERLVRWTGKRAKPLRVELRNGNRPGDIIPTESVARLRTEALLPADGLFIGDGWHGLERDAGQAYRWLESDGEIIVTRPSHGPKTIVLVTESGPGQEYKPFELRLVDERGVEIGRALVAERCETTFSLPLTGGEVARFRLQAPKGVHIASDPRVMNLRVFRIAWDAQRSA